MSWAFGYCDAWHCVDIAGLNHYSAEIYDLKFSDSAFWERDFLPCKFNDVTEAPLRPDTNKCSGQLTEDSLWLSDVFLY